MAIEKSGLYYPNRIARLYVEAIEETIGSEVMKAIFDMAEIPPDQYPPPNNLAQEFDFAYWGAINVALEQMYGERGERGLTLHACRVAFAGGLAEYGPLIGTSDLAFKAIPIRAKLKVGLKAMAETLSKFSDQLTSVEETGEYFVYTIHRCPVCWGRTSQKPICYGAVGLLEGGLHWVSGGKAFQIEEVACHAAGDEFCIFHISKEPLS